MAHIAIELKPKGKKEISFVKGLSKDVASFHGEDCRALYPQVKARAMQNGLHLKLGTGGSHIWISRESEFIEGDIHSSKRFAIITDKPLWNNWNEKAAL